jgi:osmotically-inducible protein OsmY
LGEGWNERRYPEGGAYGGSSSWSGGRREVPRYYGSGSEQGWSAESTYERDQAIGRDLRRFGYGGSSQDAAGMGWRRSGGFYGQGPKGYTRSDERIREDVCDRLSEDDELDASDISVTVQNAEITLEGSVPDRRSKHRAEDISDAVSGVRDVHNRLRARKGIMQEIGDKLTGRDEPQHGQAGSGTRNGPQGSPQRNVSS